MKKTTKRIGALCLTIAILAVACVTSTATAFAPVQPIKTAWSQDEVRELADYYADSYGIARSTLATVIDGESRFTYDLPGDDGTSWGACQIHLPDHPEITKAQAVDPRFCLDWTARRIRDGHGRMWTVYRTCILREKVYYRGKRIACAATA